MNVSYCGAPPLPDAVLARWNLDPLLLAVLLAGCWAAARLPAGRRSAGLTVAGVLAVAFISPLCAASVALFSARAVHHLLLVGVAAPLLALAVPRGRPGMAAGLAATTATLWLWHVPRLYDAALADTAFYWAMQLSLLGGGWLFWRAVLAAPQAVAAAGVAGGAAQMGMLGALLSFAPRPLYASHLATTLPYGFGPLADQQLAGLTMWVIGLVPYAVAGWWLARAGWQRMAAA